ncbi:MAG: EAL domain protein [uncultured Paraburkholderia sp.]|nr:MAG: EAL domain protein [uncultured Paraburkholderia sp.]
MSDASLRFIGYHREYLETITLHELVAQTDTTRLDALLARASTTGNVEKATLGLIKSLTYPITVELRVVRSSHHGMEGFAIAGFDVSAWRASEERLIQALHLARLTNLANQSALIPALLEAQKRADALLLDIDNYQRVNRALGYDAGDEMLRDTARRILNMTSPDETVARVASDEFAILVKPAANRTDAAAAAEALARRLLTAIQQPYVFNGQQVHLSASIGIALYPDVRHANDTAVREAINLTGIDPRRLVFEITESLLMHDPAHAKVLLEDLTAMGIRFAVDDFGTGYSSLAYLHRFPLAKLKIDRSFVENLLTSRNDQAIVSAVVGLAQTLDLELVAEGVETEAQRSLLTEMGCDHIQGWLVCQALQSDELAQRFEARSLYLHTA